MSPAVSVIIPVFNRPSFIREAVDSVLAQNFKNFEIVVIDDGSTDETPLVLHEYGDLIRVLKQENKGVSAARNNGIKNSSGKLVAFLDSDDLWMPKKLETQVSFFQNNPDAQICQTGETWIRNGKRVNPGKRHEKPAGMIFEASLNLCLVSPSAVMIKRELLEKTGYFNENFPACEDYDLWLRISCRTPVFMIATPLVVKRGGHCDQLSSMACLDRYRIESICSIIESGCLDSSQKIAAVKVLKEKCGIYSEGCLKRGRTEEASHFMYIFRKFD